MEREKQRVQGASAVLRLDGRVAGHALERHHVARQGQAADIRSGGRGRVHHQGHVDVLEASVLQHDDLAAHRFLRGRPVYDKPVRKLLHPFLDSHRRSRDGRPLHMVAAGVPDVLEGVVLAEQTYGRPGGSVYVGGAERGRKAPRSPLYGEPSFCKKSASTADAFFSSSPGSGCRRYSPPCGRLLPPSGLCSQILDASCVLRNRNDQVHFPQ